jgi:adenylate cyclase
VDASQLAAVADGSRVTRSFAFVDLCGFTDFVDAAGDAAAVDELSHLRSAVREVTPLFGVRVDKWLGDGAMLVGVDAEPLVGATVAIGLRFARTGRLPLRAGIATGAVLLLEGDDYIGKAVNVASRLCDRAEQDQILAAADGLSLPEWVTAAEHSPVTVKGMVDPVTVVTLGAERSVLRRRSRTRSTAAFMALVEGLTRPVRSTRGGSGLAPPS